MAEKEKEVLIDLICKEQTEIIVEDDTCYEPDEYKHLEELKVKIKDM